MSNLWGARCMHIWAYVSVLNKYISRQVAVCKFLGLYTWNIFQPFSSTDEIWPIHILYLFTLTSWIHLQTFFYTCSVHLEIFLALYSFYNWMRLLFTFHPPNITFDLCAYFFSYHANNYRTFNCFSINQTCHFILGITLSLITLHMMW